MTPSGHRGGYQYAPQQTDDEGMMIKPKACVVLRNAAGSETARLTDKSRDHHTRCLPNPSVRIHGRASEDQHWKNSSNSRPKIQRQALVGRVQPALSRYHAPSTPCGWGGPKTYRL
jgi:hypothetical protein